MQCWTKALHLSICQILKEQTCFLVIFPSLHIPKTNLEKHNLVKHMVLLCITAESLSKNKLMFMDFHQSKNSTYIFFFQTGSVVTLLALSFQILVLELPIQTKLEPCYRCCPPLSRLTFSSSQPLLPIIDQATQEFNKVATITTTTTTLQ